MNVAELKEELADLDDDMEVMVSRDKPSRFHNANVEEMEIDTHSCQLDGGYREADVFTRSLHRRKVILIL